MLHQTGSLNILYHGYFNCTFLLHATEHLAQLTVGQKSIYLFHWYSIFHSSGRALCIILPLPVFPLEHKSCDIARVSWIDK